MRFSINNKVFYKISFEFSNRDYEKHYNFVPENTKEVFIVNGDSIIIVEGERIFVKFDK